MVYIVPRTLVDVGKHIDNLNRSGVYLLLGTTETDEEAVYIGQADVRKNEKGAPKQVIRFREKYKDFISNSFVLTKGIRFTSPSAAAGFEGGASLNDNDYWVTDEGVTLREYL